MKKIIFTPQLFTSFIIVFVLLTISCKSKNINNKETIHIQQLNTDYPVTFFKNNENNRMIRIFFRFPFEINSNLTESYYMTSIDYYYRNEYINPYQAWLANVLLYSRETNKSIKYDYNEFKKDNPLYIYRETMHSVDTTSQVQSELKPYIDKMVELGQDTMSIPSFKEFKKEHPQLIKNLLQGDSISILIKKDLTKNPQLLGDTIIKAAIKY